MTTDRIPDAAEDSPGVVAVLEGAAMACILAVMVARPFVAEAPFRTSQMVFAVGPVAEIQKPPTELMRVTFAMVLLAGAALWALGQAFRRRLHLAGAALAVMVVAFAAWSLVSALSAADKRGALDAWVEQLAMLAAAVVVMQLARQQRRWGLVVVVLAALGATLAALSFQQVLYEVPQRIAEFRADPEKVLLRNGIVPGTPKAGMLEKRLVDPAATGYLGLANVFASLLIVLLAGGAGLAIEKIAAARRDRRSGPPPARGEVHLPTLAAIVGAAIAAAALAALALTWSKGGIAAAVVAIAAAAALMLRVPFFARHRRKLLIACAVVAVAGGSAVAGAGILRGSLPSRSMQVRWEYWVGAAGVVRDAPLRGAGPGNFGDAYLLHRLPAAAESTKTAHNVLLDAACAYGLPGAAVYLAVLVWLLVALSRPASASVGAPGNGRGMARWCVFLGAVVLIVRAVWTGVPDPAVLVAEAGIPAGAFVVAMLAALWTGRRLDAAGACGRWARIALGCGLAGFVLHNLVTYTLLAPAPATVFWVAAGAAAGAAGPRRVARLPRAASIAVAGLAVAGLMAAGLWLWRPVQRRTAHLRAAQAAYCNRQLAPAVASMKSAVFADTLDAMPAADLAQVYLAVHQAAPPGDKPRMLEEALRFARLAHERSGRSFHAILYARALLARGYLVRAMELAGEAVRLDPMNTRLRWEYAEILVAAGKLQEASEQVREIHRIDGALPEDSGLRLSPQERRRLKLLEQIILAGHLALIRPRP